MITHHAPGDPFRDLIRTGAKSAASKDNIKLVYSNDPEAPNQANQPTGVDPGHQEGGRRRDSRRDVQRGR
jgi:simple sugar transport system substrate-binding protein